ncbi:MAG: hypothetical protein LBG15_11330 [Dysgonamonadaceae bacterium]|jgi:hypothetical protein|nr:hypothetical protein [Dysgonamonadaceae bacterium]
MKTINKKVTKNKIDGNMSRFKSFLFGKKLSKCNDVLVVVFTLGTLGWFPSVEGLFFIKNLFDFVFFVIIYVGILFPLYVIFRKIMASKQEKIAISVILICILLLMIQNSIILYLYSFRVLVSVYSLSITIPVSLIVAFFCIVWMRRSGEYKNGNR